MAARDSALSDILGRDDGRVIGITKALPGAAGSAAPLMPQLSAANKVIAIMAGNIKPLIKSLLWLIMAWGVLTLAPRRIVYLRTSQA